MEELKAYYERFFGKRFVGYQDEFVTRHGKDWRKQFLYLPGLETFAVRLLKAVLLKQRIAIFADYDTDAVCASSIAYWSLMELGFPKDSVTIYAPDRFTESYGLNLPAIKKLAKEHDLIITVDCGINSLEEASFLADTSCDLIITDHHQIKESLPNATTVINPQLIRYLEEKKQKTWLKARSNQEEKLVKSLRNFGEPADFLEWKESIVPTGKPASESLVGASVVWLCFVYTAYALTEVIKFKKLRLSEEVQERIKNFTPKKLEKLLSFVALATVADCQSIKEPFNRLLVQLGLQLLNNPLPFPGLKALLDKTGFRDKLATGYHINSQDIGFTLSPILNASGRIAHAKHAIEAMTSWKVFEAENLVDQLIVLNSKRKEMVAQAMKQIQPEIDSFRLNPKGAFITYGKWSKGIVGLLASRVQSQLNVVSVVISSEGEEWAGSARAPEGYNLVGLLAKTEKFLLSYGGHLQAAGLKLSPNLVDKFVMTFTKTVAATAREAKAFNVFTPEELVELPERLRVYGQVKNILYIDQKRLTVGFFQKLWQLDPFGQDFPFPLLLVRLNKPEYREFGSEKQHIKLVAQGVVLNYFSAPKPARLELKKSEIWALVKPSINVFRQTVSYEGIVDEFV